MSCDTVLSADSSNAPFPSTWPGYNGKIPSYNRKTKYKVSLISFEKVTKPVNKRYQYMEITFLFHSISVMTLSTHVFMNTNYNKIQHSNVKSSELHYSAVFIITHCQIKKNEENKWSSTSGIVLPITYLLWFKFFFGLTKFKLVWLLLPFVSDYDNECETKENKN